jgi:probable rRNA maturation factor
MLKVDFNNASKSPIKKSLLEKIAKDTIAKSGVLDLKKKDVSLSFALVSEKEIKKLNKTYRNKNKATDVLSFPEYKNKIEIKKIVDKEVFLGEIVLCYNNIADYSNKYKLDLKREIQKVVSHGVLHLLGFRHGKKMFKLQELV